VADWDGSEIEAKGGLSDAITDLGVLQLGLFLAFTILVVFLRSYAGEIKCIRSADIPMGVGLDTGSLWPDE
jgi:hypothetical protein